MTVGAMRGCELRAHRSCGWSRELNMTNCLTVFTDLVGLVSVIDVWTVAYVDFILGNTKVVFVVVMFLQNGMLSPIAGCYLSSRMPSRIFRSSISPFHDTFSCVCDLLFSALGFLLQLLAEPRFQNAFLYTTIRRFLTDSAISTWRSLHFGWTCVCRTTELRELVAGRLPDLLCSVDACCWPCSSLPAVGHALLTSTLRIGLRVSSAPVACCHATALLFVSFVCIFGRSSRLQCQLFVPVVPLVVLFSLRVSSALVFCLPEFDPLDSVVQVTVVLRHRAVLDNLTLPLPVFFSITGSSGCDSFFVLSSSDVATCERRVPRAPLCGSLRQCDRQSGTSNATTRYCATSWSLVRGRYSRVTVW